MGGLDGTLLAWGAGERAATADGCGGGGARVNGAVGERAETPVAAVWL